MDFTETEAQKRIIDTFINSVFVFDDKITLTFNYSGENSTITLKDIADSTASGVRCLAQWVTT